MLITKLELKNFRRFTDYKLELNKKLTVIIGSNGTGKTTILDAIALQLNHFIGRMRSNDSAFKIEYGFNEDDINFFATKADIKINFNFNESYIEHNLSKSAIEDHSTFDGSELENFLKNYKKSIDDKSNIPIIIYFNDDKDFTTANGLQPEYLKKLSIHIPQINAYINACNKLIYSFNEFAIWWRIEEDKENETRLRSDGSYRHKELETSRRALKKFLKALKSENIDSLFISRSNPDKRIPPKQFFKIKSEGEFFISKNGEYNKLSQISKGEKYLVLLVHDIARRLVMANPTNPNILDTGNGVVLIDEIDQHLHPTWQKTVVNALRQTFPSLQFILTTHSPFVVQSLDNSELFSLDNVTDLEPYEHSINNVITEIMNVDLVRSDEYERRHDLALKTLEELGSQEGEISQNDYMTLKKLIDGILEVDTNDPVYKAYLKVSKEISLHAAN